MDSEALKKLIGKKIRFTKVENGRSILLYGILKDVKQDCMVIDFKGILQIYSFSVITMVKEVSDGEQEEFNKKFNDVFGENNG